MKTKGGAFCRHDPGGPKPEEPHDEDPGGGAPQGWRAVGDHRTRPGRAQGRRGPHQVRGGWPVPFRRAHPGHRHRAPAARRRPRGRRRDREEPAPGSPGSRQATGWPAPTSPSAAPAGTAPPATRTCATRARTRLSAAWSTGRSASTTAPRTWAACACSDVLPVRRAVRVVLREDRGRHPVRAGRAGQLRGDHRVLLGHLRGRRAPGRDRGDLRHRRRRHQRRAGRQVRRRQERHRGRPGGVQAGAGDGVRRHARVRRPGAGAGGRSSS